MTRLEELQAELARITIRQKEIRSEMRLIKSEQRNQYRRQIRALLNERGFTLKDAIDGRAGINSISQAIWYTSALTPFGESALMVFSRDSDSTDSLARARFRGYQIMAIRPGENNWRTVHPSEYEKIRGIKKDVV